MSAKNMFFYTGISIGHEEKIRTNFSCVDLFRDLIFSYGKQRHCTSYCHFAISIFFFSMSFQLEHLMETKSEPCLKFLGTKFIRCDEKTWKANFPYVDFRIALTLQWKSICRYFLVFQMRIACVSFSSQEALLASTG